MLYEGYVSSPADTSVPISSFFSLILYVSLSVGCSLLAAFILYSCGLKEAFKKFGRKGVKINEDQTTSQTVFPTEKPNAATSQEAASKTAEWTLLNNGIWLHAPSLSTHSTEPMSHIRTTVPGTAVSGLKCRSGCRGTSNRPYVRKQVRYSGILLMVCLTCFPTTTEQFSIYYPQKLMIRMSPNMQMFKTTDTLLFPEWPETVVYTEVSVFWCRGIPMIGQGTNCNVSGSEPITTGYYSALVMGSYMSCSNHLYYNPDNEGWDTDTANPNLRVCGTATIKATKDGKYFLMDSQTVRSEVFGNKPLRVKRGLFSSNSIVCGGVGTGGGFGIVVVGVVVVCDMSDYSNAINDLFQISMDTATLLGSTIKHVAENFDNVYGVLTKHQVSLSQIETQSVYSTIYSLQSLAKSAFQNMWNTALIEKNAWHDGQYQKSQMVSELQEAASGKKTGMIVTNFINQIFESSPSLKPEIILNSDICELDVSFVSNASMIFYNMTAECPENIHTKELQVEERPYYTVRNSNGSCMVQHFMAVIHDGLNSAIIANEAQFTGMRFPYQRNGGLTTLHWYSGSRVPDLGASIVDHTVKTARDVCPTVMVFQGEWGAVVHCGKTCTVHGDLSSHTDAILHFNRESQQEILAGGTSVHISKRLSNYTITLLSPKWGTLVTDAGTYRPGYGSFDMMGPSVKQQHEAEVNAMIIVEMRDKQRSQAENLIQQTEQLKYDIKTSWDDFKANEGAKSDQANMLAIVALILTSLVIISGAIALIYVFCIMKRKDDVMHGLIQAPLLIKEKGEQPNAGLYFEWEWVSPGEYAGRIILGILRPDGTWFDAEKEHFFYLIIRPLFYFSCIRRKLALALLVITDCKTMEDDLDSFQLRVKRTEEVPNAMAGLATTRLVTEIEPTEGKRMPAKVGVLGVTVTNSKGEREQLMITKGMAHWDTYKLSTSDTFKLLNDKDPRWYNDQRYIVLLSDGTKLKMTEDSE